MRHLLFALSVVAFAVPALAAADKPKPAAADANDPNKVICKREVVIGTLAGGRKVCHTRAEWNSIRADAQRDTERMQNQLGSQGPG